MSILPGSIVLAVFTTMLLMLVVPSTVMADGDIEAHDCGGCPFGWRSRKDGNCYRIFIDNTKTPDDAEAECQKVGAHLVKIKDKEATFWLRGHLLELIKEFVASPGWQVMYTGMKVDRDSTTGNINSCTMNDGDACDYLNPAASGFNPANTEWCAAGAFFPGSPAHPLQGTQYMANKCVAWVINDQMCGCWATIPCADQTWLQYALGYIAYFERKDKPKKKSSNMICSKPDFYPYKGNCYKCVTSGHTDYDSAKNAVQAQGANLAVLHSIDELLFLQGLLACYQPKASKAPDAYTLFYMGFHYQRDSNGAVTGMTCDDNTAVDFGDAHKKGVCKGDFPHHDGKACTGCQKEPKDGPTYTCSYVVKNTKVACRLVAGPCTGISAGYVAKMPATCPAGTSNPDCDHVCQPSP